jgi:hypothetical protein
VGKAENKQIRGFSRKPNELEKTSLKNNGQNMGRVDVFVTI